MPILIPVNVQDIPKIPIFNMEEFMNRVSQYATDLWISMSNEESEKFSRKANLSDEDLAAVLADFPLYETNAHDDMSQLTRADYCHFANHHKTMKGIEKWM